MRRIFLTIVFLAAALLASCAANPAADRPAPPPTLTPPAVITAVRTMGPPATAAPEPSATPAWAYPYPPPGCVADCETVTAPALDGAYPAPGQGLLAAGEVSAPFQGCAVTPGLVGCDAQAPALPARLALNDAAARRVLVFDLQNGAGWQAPFQAEALDWSPDGQRLLVNGPTQSYALFSADGRLVEGGASEESLYWQPGGELERAWPRRVYAADGRAAWLTTEGERRLLLHVQSPDGSEAEPVSVAREAGDQMVELHSWVPGRDSLLAYFYYGSSSSMMFGGSLAELDAVTGEARDLGVMAPLGFRGRFDWNPRQPGWLAFLASAPEEGGGTQRLALLDFRTGQLRYPLPDGLVVDDLAWRPDGERLAFSARASEFAPASTYLQYPNAGLYLLDPRSGEVEALTQAAQQAHDGWPHWLADGQVLVYARWVGREPQNGLIQVRAQRTADGQDWLLAVLPANRPDPVGWREFLALTAQPEAE